MSEFNRLRRGWSIKKMFFIHCNFWLEAVKTTLCIKLTKFRGSSNIFLCVCVCVSSRVAKHRSQIHSNQRQRLPCSGKKKKISTLHPLPYFINQTVFYSLTVLYLQIYAKFFFPKQPDLEGMWLVAVVWHFVVISILVNKIECATLFTRCQVIANVPNMVKIFLFWMSCPVCIKVWVELLW